MNLLEVEVLEGELKELRRYGYVSLHYLSTKVLFLKLNLLEVEVLEGEVDLHDAGCLDPGPQDVLLRGLVVLRSQPIQVVQETGEQSIVN